MGISPAVGITSSVPDDRGQQSPPAHRRRAWHRPGAANPGRRRSAGHFAITYGYQQFDWPLTLVTVVIIVVVVQAAQLLGNRLARIALRR
jgi:hypothetical protein